MLHQYDEAIESLNQLLVHTPNDSMALAARGLLRARSGMRELAVKDGNLALALNESADCLYQVARIFAQASKQHPDDADNSVRLLREAIRKNIGLATMADQDPDLSPISSRSDFGNVLDAALQLSGTMNESSAL